MSKAPKKCPVCNSNFWNPVDVTKEKFNVGKAIVGTALLGPLGPIAGCNRALYLSQNGDFHADYLNQKDPLRWLA